MEMKMEDYVVATQNAARALRELKNGKREAYINHNGCLILNGAAFGGATKENLSAKIAAIERKIQGKHIVCYSR